MAIARFDRLEFLVGENELRRPPSLVKLDGDERFRAALATRTIDALRSLAMRPLVFEKDPAFWFETLRCLSHVADGGADVGERLSTAVRIVEGDYDSWHDEWLATADRVAREAELGLGRGHRVSARGALLRPPTTTVRPSSSCMPTRTIPASTTRGSAYEDLTCPRTFIKFTAEEGAGAHCEAGAATLASARIYDWLDDVLLRR